MREHLRPALALLLIGSLACGIVYPLTVTGIAQLLWPAQANGSLVQIKGQLRGSRLIGQDFQSPRYFHGRPSALAKPYDATNSGGSNDGATRKALQQRIAQRLADLHAEQPDAAVPADLVYASGSGLDPDISPEAAAFQLPRIARARGLDSDKLRALLLAHTQPRGLGMLGEPRVNVLELNLALDAL